MKNITFNRISFFRAFPIVGVLCFIIFGTVNLLAQTAMVTNNFVWYLPEWLNPPTNFQCSLAEIRKAVQDASGSTSYMPSTGGDGDRSFITNSTFNYGIPSNDPWHSSALIEYDNVFPSIYQYWSSTTAYAYYPNHCLTLCAEVTCSNPVRLVESSNSSGTATVINTVKSGDFPIQTILFDIFKYQANANPYNADSTPPIRTIAMYPAQGSDVDNICKGVPTCCNAEKNSSCLDNPQFEISCCDACTWSYGSKCVQTANACTTNNCSPAYCSRQNTCSDKASTSCHNHTTSALCYSDPNCDWVATCTTNVQLCSIYIGSRRCNNARESGEPCFWNGHRCVDDHNYCTYDDTTHACVGNNSTGINTHCTLNAPICENRPTTCASDSSCPSSYCTQSQTCVALPASESKCASFTEQEPCDNSGYCTFQPSDLHCYAQNGVANSSDNTCQENDSGTVSSTHPCHGIDQKFPDKETCRAGLTTLHFCTAWDGSYEIDGEFGKTNGQFGFRTTIKTNYPGDGISVTSNLSIEHMIVYPGDTQIPIQVDVTNVHSVRSSPTVVGTAPAVTTAPYKLRYRLSKDATTTIDIIDPEMSAWHYYAIHRHLVNGQPRDGEGFQGGAQQDITVTNEDSWDGRDDNGRLLPYGNYIVSIQASSRDEWTGNTNQDLSRAVTRQLSLDPLKITNIAVTGLSKESTAYAKIDYMLTEAATVHLEIYTPGTVFKDLNICNVTATSPACTNGYKTNSRGVPTAPVVANDQSTPAQPTGYRVASYTEQKASRVLVNSKWDGMCWDETNCQNSPAGSGSSTTATGYAYGGALPDGNYVYLLWAEIPYGSASGQPGRTFYSSNNVVTVNNVEWDGVKTYMIYNGTLPINRGYPEITIDAVSYSTIGSSPVANGLDPFVISYSLSRDSYVDAGIWTTAANGTTTAGVCESSGTLSACAPYKVKTISENEVKEALTKNTYHWNGLDDNGRYVSPGNYMLRITAKDALFPAKMVTRTIEFPVDMFRLVDVKTTPLLETGSSNTSSGLASISYMLSKSMDVSVKIYNRGVVIPNGGMDNNTPAQPCIWPPLEQDGITGSYCMNNPECCIHETVYSSNPVTSIKEFKGINQGEGYTTTHYWDGYHVDFNAIPSTTTTMVPDGLYPYIIVAKAQVPGAEYYNDSTGIVVPQYGPWHSTDTILASDRVTGYITVSRGAVFFTNIEITPTRPTQYYSSATVELAPYEVQFSVNRISSVTVDIISTVADSCMGLGTPAGTVCRTLTLGNNSLSYNVYDANVLNKLYWDGKDTKGNYVKYANYQVRFTAQPYIGGTSGVDSGLSTTVENRNLVVNNFQVFDRYIWDVSTQNKNQGKFAYQISVPMKTAIQIFKPGTRVANIRNGNLYNPIQTQSGVPMIVYSTDTRDVLVKSIVGVRPNLVSLEEIWDGTDYAGQKVPDGIYPFRYVTVTDSYRMNSITGDPIVDEPKTTPYPDGPYDEVPEVVMDWDRYINFEVINVANGDSWYADIDWKDPKVTMFYPNPLTKNEGFFEITKVPAPGKVTIKIYNIAGDLVKDSDYDCVNAIGTTAKLEDFNNVYGGVSPDWNMGGATGYNPSAASIDTGENLLGSHALGRNFAMRCKWDRTNQAGKRVARGLYYAIMTLKPTRGNAKNSQRVIKILIP